MLELTMQTTRSYNAAKVITLACRWGAFWFWTNVAPLCFGLKLTHLTGLAMQLHEDICLPDTLPVTMCEALTEFISGATLPFQKWPILYARQPERLADKPLRRFSMVFVIACWKCIPPSEKGVTQKVSLQEQSLKFEKLMKGSFWAHTLPCLLKAEQSCFCLHVDLCLHRMNSWISQIGNSKLQKCCHCLWGIFCACGLQREAAERVLSSYFATLWMQEEPWVFVTLQIAKFWKEMAGWRKHIAILLQLVSLIYPFCALRGSFKNIWSNKFDLWDEMHMGYPRSVFTNMINGTFIMTHSRGANLAFLNDFSVNNWRQVCSSLATEKFCHADCWLGRRGFWNGF